MQDFLIFGVSAIIVVPLFVQGLKLLGMPDSFAPWATLITAVALAIVAQLVIVFPAIEPWLRSLFMGIMVFLGGTGLYHVTKNTVSTLTKNQQDPPPAL